MRRLFTFCGIFLLIGGPFEVVAFFGLIPGFGSDIASRIPGPTWLKQVGALLTPPTGFVLVLWALRGIGDLELTREGVVLPVASVWGIIRGNRKMIPFEDIDEARVSRRKRAVLVERVIRRPDRDAGTRMLDLRWAADDERFLQELRQRVKVVDSPKT